MAAMQKVGMQSQEPATNYWRQAGRNILPPAPTLAEWGKREEEEEAEARRAGGLQSLTVEAFWELLTRHQADPEEAEVVGTVVQVVGYGPVHAQVDEPRQGRLCGRPP